MTWIKDTLNSVAISICVGITIMSALPTQVFAQSFKAPNRGTPPTTSGGATRGSCSKASKPLISLLPKEKLGLTLSDRPTFYWHKPSPNAQTAEFILLDTTDNDVVYETKFELPRKTGIIAFNLPANAPALKVGKRYHWYVSVPCTDADSEETLTVEGWVDRTLPNAALTKQIERVEASKRAAVYANAGFWHETMTSAVQFRCQKPNDPTAKANWKALLESVGLKDLVSQPLLNSCQSRVNS
jgi:Domain of Unknown Function (DUF928)